MFAYIVLLKKASKEIEIEKSAAPKVPAPQHPPEKKPKATEEQNPYLTYDPNVDYRAYRRNHTGRASSVGSSVATYSVVATNSLNDTPVVTSSLLTSSIAPSVVANSAVDASLLASSSAVVPVLIQLPLPEKPSSSRGHHH